MDRPPEYDPRYLAGIELFNAGDYFAAHEVWEDLWHECASGDRMFYQSLIQAAVSLYHWEKANRVGARRLFDRGRGKMAGYRPVHRGLDVDGFWRQVETALADPPGPRPRIELSPTPADGHPNDGADHDR